ncbi:MAG: MerR family DNA-binding transcriptional regulator, partial [Planctomycetota bacterium]
MQTQTPVLRIGPLANRFGVSPESLRVWERQGLIPQSHRTPGGH